MAPKPCHNRVAWHMTLQAMQTFGNLLRNVPKSIQSGHDKIQALCYMYDEIRCTKGLLAYSTKSFVPLISQFMVTVHSNHLLCNHYILGVINRHTIWMSGFLFWVGKVPFGDRWYFCWRFVDFPWIRCFQCILLIVWPSDNRRCHKASLT